MVAPQLLTDSTKKARAKAGHVQHLLLIRHGQTDANRLGIVQGHSQWELNALGRRQAALVAERLGDFKPKIDVLVCSDLLRAQQTARPIAAALGDLPIHSDAAWRERCYGQFENLSPEARQHRMTELGLCDNDIPPGAQTIEEYQRQVREAFLSVPKLFADARCIAIVTHGGACKSVLAMLADGRLPATHKVAVDARYTPNCSVTHLTLRHAERAFKLELVHCTEHLSSIEATATDNG
jgi:probable phosphoglycerate mutase